MMAPVVSKAAKATTDTHGHPGNQDPSIDIN
jgi:hypothetical protein